MFPKYTSFGARYHVTRVYSHEIIIPAIQASLDLANLTFGIFDSFALALILSIHVMPRNKCPTTKLDHSFLSSSLHAAEVAYVKSQHNVEDLRAQEDERRLRVLLQILENENEASKERILAEAHRAEMEAAQSIEHRADKERAESEADILKGDLTVREHECETLRV